MAKDDGFGPIKSARTQTSETRAALDDAMRELDGIMEWMREPDTADRFTAQDLVDWANKRPKGRARKALNTLQRLRTDT